MTEQPDGELDRVHPKSAERIKADTARARSAMQRQMNDLNRQASQARSELERQRREMEAEFDLKRAELTAQMAPLKAELAKMTEVAHTMDLYLGRNEEMQVIREGQPAPDDTPITIRQRVLVMAEEAAILTEPGTTGLDYRDVATFVEWLQDETNLTQLLPEPKCVVAMRPTRVESRTGNVFEDSYHDSANAETYWLFRNGQRVTLMVTDLTVHERLVPKITEFTEFFTNRFTGKTLEPGSKEWLEAEEDAGARRRHFMKIMLTLQGVADRTSAWAPLPPTGINLMSVASQDAGLVVIVNETDNILGDGREPFHTWQHRLNGLLRPGHRIIGEFRATYTQGDTIRDRVHPPNAPLPDSNVLHTIEDRRDGGVVIRYARTDEVWKRDVPAPDRPGYGHQGMTPTTPTQRASFVIKPIDPFVLPFDLISVDDLRYYLGSREARTDFLHMVPVVKAAIAAKEAEKAQEAPFRAYLTGALDTDEGTVDDLIHWFKTANATGRALNGDPAHEAKAAKAITTEHHRRTTLTVEGDRMVAAGRSLVPDAIAVARNTKGEWWAYAPTPHTHDPGVFLDATRITKDGTATQVRESITLPVRSASRLTVAWSEPAWDTWGFAAHRNHYLTNTERAALVEQVKAECVGDPVCVVEFFDPANPKYRSMAVYGWTRTPPVSPIHDPLDARHRGTDWYPATMTDHKVTKTSDGVTWAGATTTSWWGGAHRNYLGGYSATYRDLHAVPWWPDTATKYPDVRPRLVWANDTLIDTIAAWANACTALAKKQSDAERAARDAASNAAYAYSQPVHAAVRAAWKEKIRSEFIQDYGPDSTDLWDHHWDTITNGDPYKQNPLHPRDLWGLIKVTQERGEPVAGRTLGDLAEAAGPNPRPDGEWHHRGAIDVTGYEHIVVPHLTDEGNEQ